MRKIHFLGLALFAMMAVTALTASSAFAVLTFEPASFLINGNAIVGKPTADATGELLLEDTSFGIAVECSGTLHGVIEEPKDILITSVLDLSGNSFTGALTAGAGILCKAETGCAENTDLEVWPLNLPWLGVPELDVQEATAWLLIFADGAGVPGYEVTCLVLGLKVEETCSASEGSGGEVTNVAGGIETVPNLVVEPLGPCTTGGAETGVITSLPGNLLSSPSGTLSISTP